MSDLKIPLQVTPDQAASEAASLADKMARGAKLFSEVRDDDVAIATTPKDEVWRQDKVVLYRYRPLTDQKVRTPVLITYGLIGRYTMADLQEDRSLVRNLLKLGLDLYVVDWGNPSRADRWVTIDDYVDDYLAECVRVISERHGVDKVSLLGICEGGVFTTCYAALHPETVANMVLTITPIDFHADRKQERLGHGFINLWVRSLQPEDIDRLIDAHGTLPGEFMGSVFSMMTPMRTALKYNIDLLEVVDDEKKFLNFLRMEKWIADRPHHPGEAAKQWLKDLYQDNKLVRSELELGGRKVELKNITCPVLNVFAKDDHIIPPATSQGLAGQVGTSDYTELALPGGHVGVFVGGKSQALLGPGIAKWLTEREPQARRPREARPRRDARPQQKTRSQPEARRAKGRAGRPDAP
jgi:polyhydroxyalkanoate synthase